MDKLVPSPGGAHMEVVLRDGSRDFSVPLAAIVYTNRPLVDFVEVRPDPKGRDPNPLRSALSTRGPGRLSRRHCNALTYYELFSDNSITYINVLSLQHEMLTTLQDRAKALLAEQAGKGVLGARPLFNTSHLLLLLHYYSVQTAAAEPAAKVSLIASRRRDATLMAAQAAILLLGGLGHHLLGVRAGSHLESQVELQLRQCVQYSELVLSCLSDIGPTCKPAAALERALHDIVSSAKSSCRNVCLN